MESKEDGIKVQRDIIRQEEEVGGERNIRIRLIEGIEMINFWKKFIFNII